MLKLAPCLSFTVTAKAEASIWGDSIKAKWHCLLCLCQLPGKPALSRAACLHTHTLLELVPCSPQLALRVQMHELCVCPMLVLTAYLHPQGPVIFDLMCVPTVMHAKKVQSG